ncbi:MAG: MBL fold metallo-hydrolase [Gaiellales bacterium]|nr:MAG: MBL fold metallo-hydrolase [Gaiellales bacterium]
MIIRWLGHSCFRITSAEGKTLLTDPYDTEAYRGTLLYAPLDEAPDVVTVSHRHADHANTAILKGSPEVVEARATQFVAGFSIRGISTYHDEQQGDARGDNTAFRIIADGVSVCHLGDLGHELSQARVEQIGEVDVLLIPVGGYFTIDADQATRVMEQLGPAITIPMHFRNDRCLFDIAGVEPFLAGKAGVERPGVSELEISKENLPASPKIIVLEPYN